LTDRVYLYLGGIIFFFVNGTVVQYKLYNRYQEKIDKNEDVDDDDDLEYKRKFKKKKSNINFINSDKKIMGIHLFIEIFVFQIYIFIRK